MEKQPQTHQAQEFSEEEKEKHQRITYAKNMIQAQLALRKGFDDSSEARNAEHYFEKYSKAFGDMIGAHPEIIQQFYESEDNLASHMEDIEKLLETYVPVSFKQ